MQNDRAQQQRVPADREQIGEVERDARAARRRSTNGSGTPCDHASSETRFPSAPPHAIPAPTCSGVRRNTRHEHDERRDQRTHDERDERRARVMELRRRQRLVHEIDRSKGNARCRREAARRSRHAAKHDTLKSVRRTTDDLPMGQRHYPDVRRPRRQAASASTGGSRRAYHAVARSLPSCSARLRRRPACTVCAPISHRFRSRNRDDHRGRRRTASAMHDPIDLRVSRLGGRVSARVPARARTPARPPDLLRPQDACVGVRGPPCVRVVARGDDAARSTVASRRRFAPAVLPVDPRDLGALATRRPCCCDPAIASSSGGSTKLQAEDDAHVWPADQFEAVAVEVERVFERLGLTQLSLPLAA